MVGRSTPGVSDPDIDDPDAVDRLSYPPTIVALVLALGLPPVLSAAGMVDDAFVGAGIRWVLAALVLLVVVRFESRPLTSIGLVRPRLADLAWAVTIAVAGVGVFVLTDPVVEALGLLTRAGLAVCSLAAGIAIVLTAGITEEILFRGYPIERLIGAGYGPVAACGIAWGLFTVAHVGAGYQHR